MHRSFEMRPIRDGSAIKKAKKRGTGKRIATRSKRNDVRGRLAKGGSPATGSWENKNDKRERKKEENFWGSKAVKAGPHVIGRTRCVRSLRN